MRLLTFRPDARDDIDRQALFMGQRNVDAAFRFMAAVLDTAARLQAHPGSGHVRPELGDNYRVYRVRGFPNHLIIYRYDERRVTIVRIAHGARDLGALFEGEDR